MAKKTQQKIEEKKESWPLINIGLKNCKTVKDTQPFYNYLYEYLVEKPINFATHYILLDFNGITVKIDSPYFELHLSGDVIRYKRREEDDAYELLTRFDNIRFIMRGLRDK